MSIRHGLTYDFRIKNGTSRPNHLCQVRAISRLLSSDGSGEVWMCRRNDNAKLITAFEDELSKVSQTS